MPRKKPPEGYLTAAEAARRLNVSDGMLSIYVKQGRLGRYGPEERKHKFYKESEVQAIIDADRAFFGNGGVNETEIFTKTPGAKEKNDTEFARATPDDMEGVYAVASTLFPKTTSAEDRKPLVAICPDGNYILREKATREIVAYIHLQPLKHDRLMAFMRGEIRGWQLTADDLDCFEPGKEVDLLVKSMGSTRKFGEERAMYYMQRLLFGTAKAIAELGRQGTIIRKIYATSETEAGINMSLHAKMEPLGKIGPDRYAFQLDVASSEMPLLKFYKEALAEWRQPLVGTLPLAEPGHLVGDLVFHKATLAGLDAERYLAYLCFGPRANDTMPMRRAFLEHNPDMFYHLYDRGNLAAAINVVPLKAEAIEEFKRGKRGWLFSLDEIEQFTPGAQLHLIIIDFMTAPVADTERRTLYATQLLMNLAMQFRKWGTQGIEILSIHASGGTESGRRILHSAGFRELGELVPGRVIFELDVASSSLKLLEPYKEAFAAWQREHERKP